MTNKVSILVGIYSDGRLVLSEEREIWVRYDLWEENYTLKVKKMEESISEKRFSSRSSTIEALRNIELYDLFSIDKLRPLETFIFNANIVLNPVKEEKIELIKKWVAKNSVAPIDGSIGGSRGSKVRGPSSSKMFKYIVENYDRSGGSGDGVAAWRDEAFTEVLSLSDLVNEK